MSSFFDRLAQRTLGTAVLASPRTPGLFAAPAEPVPQTLTTRHTPRPASLALAPADESALRVQVPSATGSRQSAQASAAQTDWRPAQIGDHVAASQAEANSHPTRTSAPPDVPLVHTPAPAMMREHFESIPVFTAAARPGRALATPGPVDAVSEGPPSFEPLVPPAAGAPQPAAPMPVSQHTPVPVTGPGTSHPRQAASGEPTVRITIGAIEVRTPASAPRLERVAAPQPRPGLSLNDYLRRGRGSP